MPLKQDVISAEITQGHENYMANGKTVTVKLKNGSTRILTFKEADAEGIEYGSNKSNEQIDEKVQIEEGKENVKIEGKENDVLNAPNVTDDTNAPLDRDQVKAKLTELKVEFKGNAKTSDLLELYKSALASQQTTTSETGSNDQTPIVDPNIPVE